MRGVTPPQLLLRRCTAISTHTPHARRDAARRLTASTALEFQLTRLMRGVTFYRRHMGELCTISTHTPHARRDLLNGSHIKRISISTHTPHARRDPPPLCSLNHRQISTHTPHARRDSGLTQYTTHSENFNSHASCEA